MKWPTVRVVAPSGAYLRNRARDLALFLARQGGSVGATTKILDGYLLRANKVNGRPSASIIDIPHRITWSGGLNAEEYGATPGELLVRPYLPVPIRDVLLSEPLAVAFENTATPPITLLNEPLAYFTSNFAGINATSVWGNTDRTSSNCMLHSWQSIFFQAAGRAAVAAWDHMRGDDGVVAICALLTTPVANGRVEGAEVINAPIEGLNRRVSLAVTEPWLRTRTGGKGMCGRIDPPTNPPTPPTFEQQQFRDAQSPWAMAIADHLAPGVVRWLVAIHMTLQNNEVRDYYGSRSTYIGTFLAVNDPGVATPGLYLVNEFERVNADDGVPTRMPTLENDGSDNYYLENGHLPYQLTHLDADLSVIYGSFRVRTETLNLYFTAEIFRVNRTTGALVSLDRVMDSVDGTTSDIFYTGCFGIAADGQGVAVAITGHPVSASTDFGVVYITASATETELYSTPFVRYGGTVGQSLSCVEYIGNGKYVLPVSTVAPVGPDWLADWYVAVYDAGEKTFTLAGEVEPPRNVLLGPNRYTGRMCCVQEEVADEEGTVTRHATVLATIGPYGLVAGQPGGEAGRTYISYDSCQTWHKVIDYGSPRGVMYGASPAFNPPLRKLIRGS